jgi:integral membrane protein (TIGR01906 family)
MKKWARIPSALVTIAIPLLLIMSSIRILINPFLLDYVYSLPNFPPDEFGFSTTDRLNWGKLSVNYLTNQAGIEYLADLKFENGDPIYNERELSHMLDVKNLVQLMIKIWLGVIAFLVIMAVFAWKSKWLKDYFWGISRGGWLTIGLIALIIAGVLINFDGLFTGFHRIFFSGDTWLFYSDDTLIRLFPIKLWSDAFLFMGIFTLAGSVILALAGDRISKKYV